MTTTTPKPSTTEFSTTTAETVATGTVTHTATMIQDKTTAETDSSPSTMSAISSGPIYVQTETEDRYLNGMSPPVSKHVEQLMD